SAEEAVHIERATALAEELGITFSASGGASEPGVSLKRSDNSSPWSLCRRPWTVMYFTANGRALPCCIAPFSQRGYENYTLGNATQQSLREIWTGPAYRAFRHALKSNRPAEACANCGLRWSLKKKIASGGTPFSPAHPRGGGTPDECCKNKIDGPGPPPAGGGAERYVGRQPIRHRHHPDIQ